MQLQDICVIGIGMPSKVHLIDEILCSFNDSSRSDQSIAQVRINY